MLAFRLLGHASAAMAGNNALSPWRGLNRRDFPIRKHNSCGLREVLHRRGHRPGNVPLGPPLSSVLLRTSFLVSNC